MAYATLYPPLQHRLFTKNDFFLYLKQSCCPNRNKEVDVILWSNLFAHLFVKNPSVDAFFKSDAHCDITFSAKLI